MLSTVGKLTLNSVIDGKLSRSKLPGPSADVIRNRFLGRYFTELELDEAISNEARCLEKLAESGFIPRAAFPRIEVTQDQYDKWQAGMDGMLSHDPNKQRKGFFSLHESWRAIKGRGEEFDAQQALTEALITAPHITKEWRTLGKPIENRHLRESLKTSDWGEILNVSMYKELIAAYEIRDYNLWRNLVSNYGNLKNFNEQRRVRYGGYGLLPTVAEQGTYQPLLSPGNESVKYTPSKRGGTEDLTWEFMLNDDVGAIRDIPKRLGLAAIMTLSSEVLDFLRTNPLIYDNFNLFDAVNHGSNTATGVPLASTTLTAAINAMRDQTAYGNSAQLLGGVNKPRRLWVPNELSNIGYKLTASETDVGAAGEAATTPNPIRGLYSNLELVIVDDFTDNNDWFLTADPLNMPLVEVGFLNGNDEPEMFVQGDQNVGSMFNADKITYKIRHVHGKVVLEWRGFYRGQG
jgi:hypothetical protein